uniref:Putative der and-61 secreted protein n=1 Tax=Rhipicephalus pulchellus TaxID=72859 RepID=L7LZD7_RHIPC
MKLLFYAAIFCFVISLITAAEDEEEAEEGGETEAPASKKAGKKDEEEEETEGEGGEKEEAGKKSKGAKSATGTTTTRRNQSEEAEEKGRPQAKPRPSLTKGGKSLRGRCRIREPNINCVGNSAMIMWYYDGETCVPKKVGGCKVRKSESGYLLCGRCANKCMGIPFTSPKITRVCRRKA